jgi:hypothetical protein
MKEVMLVAVWKFAGRTSYGVRADGVPTKKHVSQRRGDAERKSTSPKCSSLRLRENSFLD